MLAQETKTTLSTFTVLERAVLYARVSGDDRGKDGRNLTGQLDMDREYALKKGYRIMAEFSEDDRGASGYEINLPQLNKIREMARNGEFDVLVVRELDRLSRNLAKQLIVEEELNRYNVRVEYVLAEYEDTPEGRLNKHIRATIAEYEREKIRERLVRGRRLSIKGGNINVSDRPPYGYKTVKRNGKTTLEIIEEEAQIVRLIYGWYVEGDETGDRLSLAQIARKLTAMGIPTRGDAQEHVNKKRKYGEWNKKTVSRILTRETYLGVWHYGKLNKKQKIIPVKVPSIISREMFEAAQIRAVENKQKSRRNLKYDYLLSKQITCGCCGYKMTGVSKIVKGKGYFYYRCPSKTDFDAARPCSLPQFPTYKVDALIWNWVKSFLMDPTKLEEGLGYYQAQQNEENAPLQERLTIINDLLADNKMQLERLLSLYLKGDFSEEMLIDHKNRLETTIKNLEIEKMGLVTHLEAKMLSEDQIRDIREFARRVKEGLAAADESFHSRRRIIEMLDVRATLTIENKEKVVYAQCRLGDVKLSFVELEYYAKFWYNGAS